MNQQLLLEANIINVSDPFPGVVGNNTTLTSFLTQFANNVTTNEGKAFFTKKIRNFIVQDESLLLPVEKELPSNAPAWAKTAYEQGDLYMFVATPELQQRMQHMQHYVEAIEQDVNSNNPHVKSEATKELSSLIKFNSLTLAIQKSNEWFEKIASREEKRGVDGMKLIMKSSDGFMWYKLEEQSAYKREGAILQVCIGTYYTAAGAASQGYSIIVLKNPNNETVVAMRIDKSQYVQECKGKQNKPPAPKYMKYVSEFFKRFDKLEARGVMHDFMKAGYYVEPVSKDIITMSEAITKYVKHITLKDLGDGVTITQPDASVDTNLISVLYRIHSSRSIFELHIHDKPICYVYCSPHDASQLIGIEKCTGTESFPSNFDTLLAQLLLFVKVKHDIRIIGGQFTKDLYKYGYIYSPEDGDVLPISEARQKWVKYKNISIVEDLDIKQAILTTGQMKFMFDASESYYMMPSLEQGNDLYCIFNDDKLMASCEVIRDKKQMVNIQPIALDQASCLRIFTKALFPVNIATNIFPQYVARTVLSHLSYFTKQGIVEPLLSSPNASSVNDGKHNWIKVTDELARSQIFTCMFGKTTTLPTTTIYFGPAVRKKRMIVCSSATKRVEVFVYNVVTSEGEWLQVGSAMTNHMRNTGKEILDTTYIESNLDILNPLIEKEKLTLANNKKDVRRENSYEAPTFPTQTYSVLNVDGKYIAPINYIKSRQINNDDGSFSVFTKSLTVKDLVIVISKLADIGDKKYFESAGLSIRGKLPISSDEEYLKNLRWPEKPNMIFVKEGISGAVKSNTLYGVPLRLQNKALAICLKDPTFFAFFKSVEMNKLKLHPKIVEQLLISSDRSHFTVSDDKTTLLLDGKPFIQDGIKQEHVTSTIDLNNIPEMLRIGGPKTNKFGNPWYSSDTDSRFAGHPDNYPGWTRFKQMKKIYDFMKEALARNGLAPLTEMYAGLYDGSIFNLAAIGANGDFVWRKYDRGGGSGQNWIYVNGEKYNTTSFTASLDAADRILKPLVDKKGKKS